MRPRFVCLSFEAYSNRFGFPFFSPRHKCPEVAWQRLKGLISNVHQKQIVTEGWLRAGFLQASAELAVFGLLTLAFQHRNLVNGKWNKLHLASSEFKAAFEPKQRSRNKRFEPNDLIIEYILYIWIYLIMIDNTWFKIIYMKKFRSSWWTNTPTGESMHVTEYET